MILHTGLRTDIPAFYPEWLANRIKAGFVLVRNPFNPKQITKYRISPDVVDVISFCTKNRFFRTWNCWKSMGSAGL